jgi:hypothetical protein
VGDFFALLGWPTAWTWGMFAFAFGGSALVEAWPHLRRAWHQRRLDRRLAGNPYIQREELNEYRGKIGDDLEPLDTHRVARSSLIAGLCMGIPVWLAQRHLEDLWQYGLFAFYALVFFTALWRRLNDPPEMHPKIGPPAVTVPREAWLGLVGGLAAVALIVLFISVLV